MAKWNVATERLIWKWTQKVRSQRHELFLRLVGPQPHHTVLDLGGADGEQIATFYPYPQNVTLADLSEAKLQRGVGRYGFAGYIVLDREGTIPLPDQSFDIVYCNSVIEHVTTAICADQKTFVKRATEHQQMFACEIQRVGRSYFVQTPNRHFPIEPHSLLPFGGYLSAEWNTFLAHKLKRLWIKQWAGDTLLLSRNDMARLFPRATILPERFCGLAKSWIALFQHPEPRAADARG